ncbi:MAG TPA: hypothetical protein ENK66_08800 [Arcobacter sp.]|nr:hypothetical protein [Arcobacter sp.]
MKKLLLSSLALVLLSSSSYGAKLLNTSTDSKGNTTYHVSCNNGDYKIITKMGNTYSGSGGIFNSLEEAVSASC